MFWRFNLLTSHIDTLLDKEDVTLHEILNEDDVLQECKAQNKRLVDFLVRQDNIEELVKLITVEPSEDVDEKLRYKFPNTACELLTSDVNQITDKLAGDEGLLSRIYSFLEGASSPLNPLLASFFSKVLGILITRKSPMIVEFLQNQDNFVGHLLKHIGTSAIMDLLLRLITCIEAQDTRNACIQWLNEQQLVQKLVAMIDPSQSDERHCNAAQSLCDIVRLSREQMSQQQERADPDPLLATIESQETVTELLSHMFSEDKSESVLVNGLTVIQTLLEFRKTGMEGMQEQMTTLDQERLAHGVSNTLMALTPRLKDLHDILVNPPKQHYRPMPTSLGPLEVPLGNSRLQVARLVAALLHTNSHAINSVLVDLGTIGVLLDLFFQFSWNNFLHLQVEMCVVTILTNAMCPDDSDTPEPQVNEEDEETDRCVENPLLAQLFTDIKIVDRILEGWEENDNQQSRPQGKRKGCMGHLTRIANHVVESTEKGTNAERIKNLISQLPSEGQDRWADFAQGQLAELNKQNTVELVGNHSMNSSSEDDDPDFRDIAFPQDTAMQQAFTDYQLQQMTSNFIDQFGFNEDEFAEQEDNVNGPFTTKISSINFDINTDSDNQQAQAASLFEQVVNERMQQYDDNESEEDLWEEKEITFSHAPHTSTSTGQTHTPTTSTRLSGSGEVSSTHRDSDSEEEEGSVGSSDGSSDDLASPRVLPVNPSPATTPAAENMDVDSSEQDWATFDPMETTPAETQPANWPSNTAAASPSSSSGNEATEGWADFDSIATAPSGDNKSESAAAESSEKWADFSSFNKLNSTDPGPRSSSPVAMETNEVTPAVGRGAAYLAESAPADLSSSIEEAAQFTQVDSTTTSLTPSAGQLRLEDIEDSSDNVVSSTTPPPLPLSQPPGHPQTTPDEPSDLPQSTVPIDSVSPDADAAAAAAAAPSSSQSDSHFLASSGMLKCGGDNEIQNNSPSKIEQTRVLAQEAMSQYSNASSSGKTHNGPV